MLYKDLSSDLKDLASKELYRYRKSIEDVKGAKIRINNQWVHNFSSNDYLGLTQNKIIKKSIVDGIKKYGNGSGSSHLISGHYAIHDQLEKLTAESLGLGSGKNVFTTLFKLRDALNSNDSVAILASMENLDSSFVSINNNRAIVGASLNRINLSNSNHEIDIVNRSQQLSDIEDADIVKSVSDLANLEFALQATLSATASVLQPTLLDFLR